MKVADISRLEKREIDPNISTSEKHRRFHLFSRGAGASTADHPNNLLSDDGRNTYFQDISSQGRQRTRLRRRLNERGRVNRQMMRYDVLTT